jgi:hypothetical protein
VGDVARIEAMVGSTQTLAAAAAVPGLLSVGTLVGLALGYFMGRGHAMWVRARKDYVTARTTVPKMRATKWTAWWSLTKWVAIVVATVWFVMLAL